MSADLVTWILVLAWGLLLAGAYMFDMVQLTRPRTFGRRVRSWAICSLAIGVGVLVATLRSGGSLVGSLLAGFLLTPLTVALAGLAGWLRYELPFRWRSEAEALARFRAPRATDFSAAAAAKPLPNVAADKD